MKADRPSSGAMPTAKPIASKAYSEMPTPIQRRSADALAPSRVTSNTSLPPMRASTPSSTA